MRGRAARVQLIGGPTALIEVGGVRLITDPTFSPPGPQGPLTKLRGPALAPEQLGVIHAVLLSHDQHADNLDAAGREFLTTVPVVFSTRDAADRVGANVVSISAWRYAELERAEGSAIKVTGVPAHHGPDGTEDSSGQVIGFVLSAADIPTVYVSGDNASLQVVEEVAHHLGPIDVAVLFTGGARTPRIEGYVSLTSDRAAAAAQVLNASTVIPVHAEGWAHFTQGPDTLKAAFAAKGVLNRLALLRPGDATEISVDGEHP